MDVKDSSEEEETQDIAAFTKFDETIVVRNAEEIKSPVNHRPSSSRKLRRSLTSDGSTAVEMNSPRGKPDFMSHTSRYSGNENNFGKSLGIASDPSDTEESDDDDIQGTSTANPIELYNPKEFEDLEVSTEAKELFQNIMRYRATRFFSSLPGHFAQHLLFYVLGCPCSHRGYDTLNNNLENSFPEVTIDSMYASVASLYSRRSSPNRYTPQRIELNYKLIPFIPDYIPAVGDIDAFIKISRPDNVEDKIGLFVLDEPCTDQSDPAVLHLQLRSHSRSAGGSRQTVIKRIDDAEKNGKSIDKWIDDMNQLHRSKHPPAVQLAKPMPDIDALLQQWPTEVEERLNEAQIDFTQLECDLPGLVDVVCNLLDIPTQDDDRLEALHTLFTLYLEVRNVRAQKF